MTGRPIMIMAGESSPEAAEAKRIRKRIEALKRRLHRGDIEGFNVSMPSTNRSGARMINDSKSLISSITAFVKTQVKVSDEENPWVKRD